MGRFLCVHGNPFDDMRKVGYHIAGILLKREKFSRKSLFIGKAVGTVCNRKWFCLLWVMLLTVIICGCSSSTQTGSPGGSKLLVGMVTDAGTIDDKSFNQGTWEGIVKAGHNFGLKAKYLRPAGTTTADYDREIANLHDAGYTLIVMPGFKFENSIFTAQDKYPGAKFVIIDGSPRSAKDYVVTKVNSNAVALYFAEHESGFLAGVAAALQMRTGQFGFVGGMEIPPVQKFNWGFQQGIQYANENFATAIELKAENILYQGTFSDVAAGQQIAAQLYDKGVTVIFAAAGSVGVGVINEAVSRSKAGRPVWVIGVDTDQYGQGFYDAAKTKSVILTSAMKYIDQAAYDMVKSVRDGTFPGGQTLIYGAKNDGVGIPVNNPNLDADTVDKVQAVFTKLKRGEIAVADQRGSRIR